MANLSVRNLNNHTYEQLRLKAQAHGVSMEEEVRQILMHATTPSESITKVFKSYFGKKNGVNLKLLNSRKPHPPMDLI